MNAGSTVFWNAFLLATLAAFFGCAKLSSRDTLLDPTIVNNSSREKMDEVAMAARDAGLALQAELISVRTKIVGKPSHERNWRPEYKVLPFVDFDGVNVIVRNVRDARYRSAEDYDVRHYDLKFDLTDLQSVDFVVVPFQTNDLLAHTMLSFGLKDGRQFLISVEARMEQGEDYPPLLGVKNEYELMYVVGDERDLIPLRTDVRKVDCYVYPGRSSAVETQRLFIDIVDRINQISASPEFYNTLSNNCTTNLVDHVNRVFPGKIPYNWKILLPGRSDELAFDLKLLDIDSKSFASVKHRYRINDYVQREPYDANFSSQIRQARLNR